ncbi:MAG: SpoIIE family protein phosphatase [bacterium]
MDTDRALEEALMIATNLLGARDASILLVDEEVGDLEFKIAHGAKAGEIKKFRLKMGEGIGGWVAQHGEAVLVSDASKDHRFKSQFDAKTGFTTKSLICVPLKARDRVIGVIQVLNKKSGENFNERDKELLTNFALHAGTVIENARLYEQIYQGRQKSFEREIAYGMQKSLVPTMASSFGTVEIGATSTPAKSIGGDYYDFIQPRPGALAAILANTSARGLTAALLMTVLRSAWRALLAAGTHPATLLKAVNDLMRFDIGEMDVEIALNLFMYDDGTRELDLYNAGAPAPLMYSAERKKVDEFKANAVRLGKGDAPAVAPQRVTLAPGDVILCFTAGVNELLNAGASADGIQSIVNLLEGSAGSDPTTLVESALMSLCNISRDAEIDNDITLFALKGK